ncbi:MAG: response regulator [Spirochaetales bacterium]|nr:response regulator [Spirochaetales bacterium]
MLKAILADDEPVIVKGLTRLIDWKQKGIQIAGSASDGNRALELVRTIKPDILISDINMPGHTGIELLKIINSEQIPTRVIFISGFHEFEYAHAALKYGAVDYLLKPISESQLESALLKAVDKPFNSEKTGLPEPEALSPPQLPDSGQGFYSVIQLCIESQDFTESTEGEKDIITFSTANLIRDYFSDKELTHWILERDSRLFLLLFHSQEKHLELLVERHVYQIIRLIKESLNQRLIAAVGKTVDSSENLEKAFLCSQQIMENRFFYSDENILYYKDTRAKRYSLDDLYNRQQKLIESVVKYSPDKTGETINSYLTALRDVTFGNKEATISFCLGAMVSLKKTLETEEIHLNVLDFDDQKVLNEAYKLRSYMDLDQWFHSQLEIISGEYQAYRESRTHPEIDKIKKYIENHYSDNIRLQDLADLVFLHPNYISGHFKKFTGKNFKDYLTDVRMAEAEKLLTASDLKVYEVAEHVGFTDYRHFSEVFKKKFGVSPRKFKT